MVMMVSLFAIQPLFFSSWLRKGLHRREFNADAFAAFQERTSYISWLRSSTRRHALKPTKLRAALLAIFYSRIHGLTHSPWKDRLKKVVENIGREQVNEQESALNFLVLCVPSGIFAVFSWVGTGFYTETSGGRLLWNLTFVSLLFPASYLSISMFRFLERHGTRKAVSLSIHTAACAVFFYLSLFLSNLLTGDATGIFEAIRGATKIFAIIFSMGLMLTFGVYLIRRHVKYSWQFFFGLHAVNAWMALWGWRSLLAWSLERVATL